MELFSNFNKINSLYESELNFKRLKGSDRSLLDDLPKNPGVYVIRCKNKVVYIGSAGKITRNGTYLNGTIWSRLRYSSTPYRFEEELLKYNPTTSGVPPEGYGSERKIEELEITCFYFDPSSDRIAPTALEHLLIQAHLNEFGVLPEINQKI